MKPILTIIFTILFSLGYAQRKENERGYWKDVPVENVEMMTPAILKQKFWSRSNWCYCGSDEWFVKDGVLMQSRFVYYSDYHIIDVGFARDLEGVEISEDVLEYPTGNVLYIGKNSMTRYIYNTLIPEPFMEKSVIPHTDNIILFLDTKDLMLYLCTSEYRTDGKSFKVDMFYNCSIEYIVWAEIHYCITTTHFTILDRVNYPPIEITDTFCPAPQNPDRRITLPFPEIKQRKYRRVNK